MGMIKSQEWVITLGVGGGWSTERLERLEGRIIGRVSIHLSRERRKLHEEDRSHNQREGRKAGQLTVPRLRSLISVMGLHTRSVFLSCS